MRILSKGRMMYSVEFEDRFTSIISMDEQGEFDDLELTIDEEGVCYIRQFDEMENRYDLISFSFQQLVDLWAAMESEEGMFQTIVRIRDGR